MPPFCGKGNKSINNSSAENFAHGPLQRWLINNSADAHWERFGEKFFFVYLLFVRRSAVPNNRSLRSNGGFTLARDGSER